MPPQTREEEDISDWLFRSPLDHAKYIRSLYAQLMREMHRFVKCWEADAYRYYRDAFLEDMHISLIYLKQTIADKDAAPRAGRGDDKANDGSGKGKGKERKEETAELRAKKDQRQGEQREAEAGPSCMRERSALFSTALPATEPPTIPSGHAEQLEKASFPQKRMENSTVPEDNSGLLSRVLVPVPLPFVSPQVENSVQNPQDRVSNASVHHPSEVLNEGTKERHPQKDHHWVRQGLERNYTVVGSITSDTPRYQPPPNHPPVYLSPYRNNVPFQPYTLDRNARSRREEYPRTGLGNRRDYRSLGQDFPEHPQTPKRHTRHTSQPDVFNSRRDDRYGPRHDHGRSQHPDHSRLGDPGPSRFVREAPQSSQQHDIRPGSRPRASSRTRNWMPDHDSSLHTSTGKRQRDDDEDHFERNTRSGKRYRRD